MMKIKGRQAVSIGLTLLMLMGLLAGCGGSQSAGDFIADDQITLAAEFAPYTEVPVDEQPSLPIYKVEADLSNVENSSRFQFNDEARQRLVENGFVVIPGMGTEFFLTYEFNRYDHVPNFITTDAMLHNYHLYFQHLLKTVERNQLIPELRKLNKGMMGLSQEQYRILQGSTWENAALRNLAFFTVGSCLLDPQTQMPAEVKEVAEAELELINAHQTTAVSPVMSMGRQPDVLESLKEDYTQYIPRGHYTYNEELENYFKAMMWYGRMTFRAKDEDETRSAVLITMALHDNKVYSPWASIYDTTEFFVGRSDDPGFAEYAQVLRKVYGNKFSLKDISRDDAKWQAFLTEIRQVKGPVINSISIFDASIQPDRDAEISGFRFMGQRYTVDADIFQRLIYREVGENPAGERRMLPKGLDIPAALGSGAASQILKGMGEYEYESYPENMQKIQQYLTGLEEATWHQNLYWNWMHTLRTLTRQIPEGYPTFMLNQAWTHKELNTFLSSWTELKHDTILYTKQNYAVMGGNGMEEIDDRGYVEPNPRLYARLAALSALTRDGLQARNLLDERDAENLSRMEELALQMKTISEKELKGESLTEEEYELIRSFGGQLEHFWLEALRDQEGPRNMLLLNNRAPVVADVATAPPSTVLEEATGYINYIYAVVPVEGKLRIAKGGVYSYYEFPWTAGDRLTDGKWWEMLESSQIPELPAWTRSFMAPTGECRVIMPWELQEEQ
ncbi:MAG: DUF3160 domain-containing protein [Syntrophomonadaceae bacterium]|jgi:hypothetical protein